MKLKRRQITAAVVLLILINVGLALILGRPVPRTGVGSAGSTTADEVAPGPGAGPIGGPGHSEITRDLKVEMMAGDLVFPVSFTWLPDAPDTVLYTRVTGDLCMLRHWEPVTDPVLSLKVNCQSDRGLLGIALAPDFARSRQFYLFHTYGTPPQNRLLLCHLDGDRASIVRTLLDGMPSGGVHNGGILRFGPDGKLYVSTGDGVDMAEDLGRISPLGGKVLRLEPDGRIPADNPTPGSPVWARGFRNVFGLCFDTRSGMLYNTDNGPDTDDEVNVVERGKDYGWPRVLGYKTLVEKPGDTVPPLASFETAMGITGILIYRGKSLPGYDGCAFVGDANFGNIWILRLNQGGRAVQSVKCVPGNFGLITDIRQGRDGYVYFSTWDGIYRLVPDPTGASGAAAPPAGGSFPPHAAPPVNASSERRSSPRP